MGPNGSGKSNITDAVLFALGEGSPSLLRASLMDDLIFSGSDSLPVAGAAEVTLVLNNSEGTISLPYEEVSLTRRISRDGETEYRLNGALVRLTDVRAVAGEAGFGRHSILRQGAVDAIVAGGPSACRMALEEAAGLGVFRRRRVAASRKLQRAATKLESSRHAEAELSSQLRRIEAEAVAAREHRKLEARYRELSLAHLYRSATQNLDNKREQLGNLQERVGALQSRQESLRDQVQRLGKEEKELEVRLRAAEETIQGLEDVSEDLQTEALRAERVLLRLQGPWNGEADRSRLLSRLEAELDETTSRVRLLEEEVDELEEEYSQRKRAFAHLEELVSRGRVERAGAAEHRALLSGALETLRERREGIACRLEEVAAFGEEEMECLGEVVEAPALYAPEDLRMRSTALLKRLEEVHEIATERAAEADRRRGVLAALVGRTEAEIQALRSSGGGAVGSKRLHEILRPRLGYEVAVESALGDLAEGVLADDLDEGLKCISGENPAERVVVRLDAEGVPKNGAPPGKPLLDCVEILDTSYTNALERLLEGAYVLDGTEGPSPKSGYDVAVTREGLRITRTNASRRVSDGGFTRQARLAEEEKRLDALKNRLGEELYDVRERVSSVDWQMDEQIAEVQALASAAARTSRIRRLLISEAGRRARRVEAARERRSIDEADLRGIEAEISSEETVLHAARESEERAKEELDAALLAAESAYAAAREAAAHLARARTDLRNARERQGRISRGLNILKEATTTDTNVHRTDLADRVVEQARRLSTAAREYLVRLRRSRSEATGLQSNAAKRRTDLVREAGEVAAELAKTEAEAVALRGEISRAEEAQKGAEAEIFDEWGATLENARHAAGIFPESADLERERARLALKLKNFNDVNLLAISQEGQLRERYELVAAQRSDAEAAAAEIERIIQDVDENIEARFNATFREVQRAFASMVPRMMEGGAGELWLSEEGVDIGLKLRGRGWRPLRVLSGGERSLLALSFLFSIFLGRLAASPRKMVCMLDEAEAALDDVNLTRFLAVVDSYRADGQFLLVTHQKRTMAAADVLYGVAQDVSGASVVVSKRLTGE